MQKHPVTMVEPPRPFLNKTPPPKQEAASENMPLEEGKTAETDVQNALTSALTPPMRFMINRQSAVPLHIQIKEQIRYAIVSNTYRPGQMLPSIRELTAELGIHRNTVHRVYLELQANGLLVSLPGKGVFVNERLAQGPSHREWGEVHHLIECFFEKNSALGVNALSAAHLVMQRAGDYDARHPSIAFIECTSHQSHALGKEIARHFGVKVEHCVLEDLRQNPKILGKHLYHLITSMFHADEVQSLVNTTAKSNKRKVHTVAFDLHPSTWDMLQNLPVDTQLAFICHDANTEEVIGKQVEECAPPGILMGCANLDSPEYALEMIAKAKVLLITEPAAAFCIKHATPQHQLLELHFALNAASVEQVARRVLHRP